MKRRYVDMNGDRLVYMTIILYERLYVGTNGEVLV